MNTVSRRRSFSLLLGRPPESAAGLITLQTRAARFTPISSRETIRKRYFPEVTLTTHEGRRVRLYEDLIKDRIVTINFMYAVCDGVCPAITSNLAKVQRLLGNRAGKDIFMYSFTLKPAHDTPAVLKEYALMHAAKAGWSFVTGTPADMERVRRGLGFVDPDPARDRDSSQHIGNIRYGNEALTLWAACPGLALPSRIVESLGWVDWPKGQHGGKP